MVVRSARYRPRQTEVIGWEATDDKASSRAWLITFTDLVSLLLTFFVMLFAMSNVKLDEWKNISDSLSQTLRPTTEPQVKAVTATFNIGTIYRKEAIDLDYLSSILVENIARTEGLLGTRVTLYEDRLVVTLPGDLLFQGEQAVMSAAAQSALFILGGVFQNIGNEIGVNGYSDLQLAAGSAYSSNWELSTSRAVAVANALGQAGYQDKITALGFADNGFQTISSLPVTQRQALGRRIEIVVLPTVRAED